MTEQSNKKRVAGYLTENPQATNSEVSDALGINENSVKAYLSQLKSGGFFKVKQTDGERHIVSIKEFTGIKTTAATAGKIKLKQEVYNKLLECYMADLDLSDDVESIISRANNAVELIQYVGEQLA